MLVTQSVNLNVPSVENVVANITDNSSYPRAFYFRNQHTSPVEIKVQYSNDGGATWTNISPTPVQLASNGILAMWISTVGSLLRIRASGGPGIVYFGLARFFIPSEGQPTGLNLSFFE